MNLSWQVHRAGSFALRAGTLANDTCYPALDGQPVHPRCVAVTSSPARSQIVCTLAGATLTLRLDVLHGVSMPHGVRRGVRR